MEKYPDKIRWDMVWSNPSIFECDYTEMKKWGYTTRPGHDMSIFEEMMRKIFHPKNMEKFAGYGLGMGYDEDEDFCV